MVATNPEQVFFYHEAILKVRISSALDLSIMLLLRMKDDLSKIKSESLKILHAPVPVS